VIDILLPILFLVGIIALIGLVLAPFIMWGRKRGKIRHANFIAAKALYDKSLSDLQEDPESADKHTKALQLGREHYAYLHPNLCDFGKDERPISFRDNAGLIEMKVQSDIQARTKKGKVS